jgi:hypothetical protein
MYKITVNNSALKGFLYLLLTLILNLSWLFLQSPREEPPESQGMPGYNFPIAPALKGYADSRLIRINNESDLGLLTRLNATIHETTWHCQPSDLQYSPYSRIIPIINKLYPDFSSSIQEQGPISLEGGFFRCGFCHQTAELLAQTMSMHGVRSVSYSLNGHVVVLTDIEGELYFSDPDLGIPPFRKLEPSKSFKNQIRQMYLSKGLSREHASRISAMYISTQNNGPYRAKVGVHWDEKILKPQHIVIRSLDALGWFLTILFCLAILNIMRVLFILTRKRSQDGNWSVRSKK